MLAWRAAVGKIGARVRPESGLVWAAIEPHNLRGSIHPSSSHLGLPLPATAWPTFLPPSLPGSMDDADDRAAQSLIDRLLTISKVQPFDPSIIGPTSTSLFRRRHGRRSFLHRCRRPWTTRTTARLSPWTRRGTAQWTMDRFGGTIPRGRTILRGGTILREVMILRGVDLRR